MYILARRLMYLSAAMQLCALAQGTLPNFEVGVFGGGQFWKLDKKKYPLDMKLGAGPVFGGRVGYEFTDRWGGEAAFAYGSNKEGFDILPGFGPNHLDFSTRNYQISAGPLFYLKPFSKLSWSNRVRPFLTAGPSLWYFKPTDGARQSSLDLRRFATGPLQLANNHTGGLFYGGGVKFWLTNHLDARFDLRGLYAFNPHIRYFAQPTGTGTSAVPLPTGGGGHGLQATVGVGYALGSRDWAASPTAPAPSGLRVSLVGPEKEVYQGDAAKYTASAEVPAGTTVQYNWRVGGQPAGKGESITIDTTNHQPGTYPVEVVASAAKLGSGTGNLNLTVLPVASKELNLSISGPGASVFKGDRPAFLVKTDAPGVVNFDWKLDSKPVGSGDSIAIDTKDLEPGKHTVEVTASTKGFKTTTGTSSFALLNPEPPQLKLSIPSEAAAGEKVKVTVDAKPGSAPIGPLTITASDGQVSGDQLDTSTVQFDPAIPGRQRKPVTVTARVTDARGQATTASAVVNVVRNAKPVEPVRLPDVVFALNSGRVNNCGKRVLLEELKAHLDRDPGGTVVLVSHSDKGELNGTSRRRAMNAAAVSTAGTGICLGINPSKVMIGVAGLTQTNEPMPFLCGTSTSERAGRKGRVVTMSDRRAQYRRVEVWFVPAGGSMPPGTGPLKAASTYSLAALGCPR